MNARQHASKIGRQTSRALAIAALTLGLATTALAPSSALAASLTAPVQDASVQGIFGNKQPADLTVGIAHSNPFTAGQRDLVPVVIENHGASTDRDITVKIMVSFGYEDITVRGAFGQDWECKRGEVGKYSGITTFTCETDGLDADSHKSILVNMTANDRDFGDGWIVAMVDPENKVKELDETNNIGKQNLGPHGVFEQQFLNPEQFMNDD